MGELGIIGLEMGGEAAYIIPGYTAINANGYAPCGGKVKTVDLRVRSAGTFKIKIFRYWAGDIFFIAETSLYLTAGLQSGIPVMFPIEADYYIGNYSADGTTYCGAAGTGGFLRKQGDIVSDTYILDWDEFVNNLNLAGHIFGRGCYLL